MRRVAAWIRRLGALALALALGTGCSIPARLIEFDSLGGAPATDDGLHRVRTLAVGAAYLKPGPVSPATTGW